MYEGFIIVLLIILTIILLFSAFLIGANLKEGLFIFIFLILSSVVIIAMIEYLLYYALIKQEDEILPAPITDFAIIDTLNFLFANK